MIRSSEDEAPPTSPTIDAPSWLEPGAAPTDRSASIAAATTHGAIATPDGVVTATTAPVPSAAVRRVEQFLLLERIGAGGMGEVFAAFDDKLERKVAIKLVATQGSGARAQQRLLREAQALARLSHPNVVTIYEVGTLPDGGLFIAMELVKGQTLRTWQAQPRTWREVVAMYVEAGRGLAAAHDSGVVHRDFKPDNVLVGDDRRVRVADFGIAFAFAAETEGDRSIAGEGSRELPGSAETTAGRFAGTPGYMAPEQLAGRALDARADQFSFCISLYEALHGERPPDDPAAHGGRSAPRRSEIEPPYPRWLSDLLLRGLARDPHDRFPSMAALLDELTRHRERSRRRILAAALIGAAAIIGVSSAALRGGIAPPCPLATDELTGVWDPMVRLRSQAAILGTAAPFAATTWASTATAFDRYAQRWLDAHRAACEATHVRHAQSEELLDRRMECLAARRRSLGAAVDVMQHRPAQAIAHAGEILGSLGDIELCADTGVLLEQSGARAVAATPARATARAQAAAVRQRLANASALLATGDVAGAEPVVVEAAKLAKDLDDDTVRAEVQYFDGRIKLERGEVAASLPLLDRAAALAISSHHDELAADIWLTLALRAGTREQRPVEMELWLSQAESWLHRLGHAADSRRIEAEQARGILQRTNGEARGAVATLTHALETAETLWGKDDPRLIPLLRTRATTLGVLRDAKPAVADAERALALGITAWGPDYPDIARTRRALGLLYIEQINAIERGEHELTLAVQLYRAQVGADSIEVANCEQALSKAGLYRGDYVAALEHAERADRIYAARLGPDHPRRGEALIGVGALRYMRKDFAGSLSAYETAYSILRATLGPTHQNVGVLLSNIGETLLALGRFEPAQVDLAQALDILERKLGPQHPQLALPLKGLGLLHLSRGKPRDALAPFERALALRVQAAGGDPEELAEIRWGLARALRATGRDPARARELAEAAAAGFRELGRESADRVEEISRWQSGARGR